MASTSTKQKHTVLVTGSNGFVGRRMVEMAAELPWVGQVHALDLTLPPFGEWETRSAPVRSFAADLRRPDTLRAAVQGCSAVIHVASLTELSAPKELFHAINVQGTQNLLDVARQLGVKVFVYTSSASVVFGGEDIRDGTEEGLPYPKSFADEYTVTKCLAERLVVQAGKVDPSAFVTVCIRPHSIYGPRDHHYFPKVLSQAALGKLKVVLGSGENLSSYTYVDNCVHAHLLAASIGLGLDHEGGEEGGKAEEISGEAFFVNDGVALRFWEVLKDVAVRGGGYPASSIGRIHLPPLVAYCAGFVSEKVSANPVMTRFTVLMATKHHYYSIEKARRVLRYSPLVTPKEAMDITLKWLRENSPAPEPPKPRSLLSAWLWVVVGLSVLGASQSVDSLRARQFVLAPDQVSPITKRLFTAWTVVTAVVRAACAWRPEDDLIWFVALWSFCVALAVYSYEVFVAQTIDLAHAAPPFCVASISVVSLLVSRWQRRRGGRASATLRSQQHQHQQ